MPLVLLANLVRLAAFQHTMGLGAQGNVILPDQLDVRCCRPAGSKLKGAILSLYTCCCCCPCSTFSAVDASLDVDTLPPPDIKGTIRERACCDVHGAKTL